MPSKNYPPTTANSSMATPDSTANSSTGCVSIWVAELTTSGLPKNYWSYRATSNRTGHYYLYTGDREFLASHALPFMERAVLFFEDYLYEGRDGKLVFSPTQSPENTPGNSDSQASYNATMDVAVAKQLLRNTIAASRELGRNEDRIAIWEDLLAKMPDYMIDDHGIIKEWLTPGSRTETATAIPRNSTRFTMACRKRSRRALSSRRHSGRASSTNSISTGRTISVDSCRLGWCSWGRPLPASVTANWPTIA